MRDLEEFDTLCDPEWSRRQGFSVSTFKFDGAEGQAVLTIARQEANLIMNGEFGL